MKSTSRVPSGIPGLDTYLAGGVPAARATLVCGAIGTGKTTFAVQFLVAGAKRGEAGVLVSVDEKPRHILDDMRRFGWELDGPALGPLLTLLDASPYFTALRSARPPEAYQIAHDLINRVGALNARHLVIDGVTSFTTAGEPTTDRSDFLRMLIRALEDNLDCAIVLTAHECDWADRIVSAVLHLELGPIAGEVSRSLIVRAIPGAPAAPTAHPFDIVDRRGLILR